MREIRTKRLSFGIQQQASYYQPDLYHEHVLDVDSPFAPLVASGTKVFTCLILGDQNAGKSTFIHSFCCYDDASFLGLTSELPMLSSSFINTRFFPAANTPMDEPPFIDTDLGRGNLLLTIDDFLFFIEEQGMDPVKMTALWEKDTRYVILEFVEVGGDHLDQLMHVQAPTDTTVLERSLSLLQIADRTIYFVNFESTFSPMGSIKAAACLNIQARLLWLSKTLAAPQELVLFISRYVSISVDISQSLSCITSVLGEKVAERMANASTEPLAFLHHLVLALIATNSMHLRLLSVHEANTLNADGSINVSGVVDIVSSCFRNGIWSEDGGGIDSAVMGHIVAASRAMCQHNDGWIDMAYFVEYCEAHHDTLGAPGSAILNRCPTVIDFCLSSHIATELKDFLEMGAVVVNSQSNNAWLITATTTRASSLGHSTASTLPNDDSHKSPDVLLYTQGKEGTVAFSQDQVQGRIIRLPQTPPFIKVVERMCQNELPAQMWMKPAAIQANMEHFLQWKQELLKLVESTIVDCFTVADASRMDGLACSVLYGVRELEMLNRIICDSNAEEQPTQIHIDHSVANENVDKIAAQLHFEPVSWNPSTKSIVNAPQCHIMAIITIG